MKLFLYIIKINVFILFWFTKLYAQTNTFKYGFCPDQTNHEAVKKCNLFLIGEYHLQDGNFKISLSYYDYLDSMDLLPKYILEEWSPASGYVFNKYFETGDEFVLDMIDDNPAFRKLYRDYRNFYLSLPQDKRFKYVGVDVERLFYLAHYAVRDILLQSSLYCDYPEIDDGSIQDSCYKEMYICRIIKSFKQKKVPLAWGNKDLKADLNGIFYYLRSKDSLIIKNSLSPELYFELTQIMKSYDISKKRKRLFMQNENTAFQVEREQFMTNQVYQIFARDSAAIVYGQFGLNHVLLNPYKKRPKAHEKIRLAIALNSDKAYPLTNNKVCSNIIYYDYMKPRYYKFLQSNLSNIKPEFSKMQGCQLLVKDFENKSKTTNLILFKTR